jgi:hypothetical protein
LWLLLLLKLLLVNWFDNGVMDDDVWEVQFIMSLEGTIALLKSVDVGR